MCIVDINSKQVTLSLEAHFATRHTKVVAKVVDSSDEVFTASRELPHLPELAIDGNDTVVPLIKLELAAGFGSVILRTSPASAIGAVDVPISFDG